MNNVNVLIRETSYLFIHSTRAKGLSPSGHRIWTLLMMIMPPDKKPTPELIQDPKYQKMYVGEKLTFSCKVNTSDGWEFHWFRDSARLPNQGATYTIPSASTVNAGVYRCRATRGQESQLSTDSNTISIDVEGWCVLLFMNHLCTQELLQRDRMCFRTERPWATVTLLTGWSEVFSADRLDLKCEVHGSEDTWNYTW